MEHLKRLCADLELEIAMEPSEKGAFSFPIRDDLVIEIRPLPSGGVYFLSPIAPCPEVKREELLTHVMKGNLFGMGTFGATIGLEETEGVEQLSLSQEFLEEMDYPSFKGAVEDFANIIEYWRIEVEQHLQRAKNQLM